MDPHETQPGLACHYPPHLADAVDVTQQIEAGATRYLVRNAKTSRYFLLKPTEFNVLRQFDGSRTPAEVARGGDSPDSPRIQYSSLIRFLSKLDSLGLLARNSDSESTTHSSRARGLYIRYKLLNPDKFLASLDHLFGWALTRPVLIATFILMVLVAFGFIARLDEVTVYSSYIYDEYGLAAIISAVLTITILHEFAHGLACKHFGGEVREMGVLLIYYVLPGFYCNVTDIYRVGRKRERLWVIFAGIYWQLVVSAAGGLLWLIATPYSIFADLAFLTLVGGTFNILINCNPLIKLDGYYALSQALGEMNLQARSSAYVQSLFNRILGDQRKSVHEKRPILYLGYWISSIVYSMLLTWLVLSWIGGELMDGLRFLGVVLTLALSLLLTERWWKPAFLRFKGVLHMSTTDVQTTTDTQVGGRTGWFSRRKAIKLGFALVLLAALVAPWEASTGSDCTLVLPPDREGVVRANTGAVLADVYVQPGDAINEGARIARLSNPEIEDRLTQLTAEIDRLNNNNSKIEEELRVRSENVLSANFKEYERKRLATELKNESDQIASASAGSISSSRPLPASLAVLQSEIELKQIELEQNRKEVERYKKLFDQGLVGEQIYDRAIAEAKLSEAGLRSAQSRLEAALVDHRRFTTGAETSSLVAETESRAARSSFESLIAELHSNRQQLESLRQRYDILKRESEGMAMVAPKSGVVLGEDLRKMLGKHYERGEEICRVGEIGRFLLEIDVSEREIASVRLDSSVRFKLKTVPGRVFEGRVSKINAEPIPNQRAQRFYPVEVIVENSDGILRPGMTGFARISFGRQSVGLILAQKVWQALRPELWLF